MMQKTTIGTGLVHIASPPPVRIDNLEGSAPVAYFNGVNDENPQLLQPDSSVEVEGAAWIRSLGQSTIHLSGSIYGDAPPLDAQPKEPDAEDRESDREREPDGERH